LILPCPIAKPRDPTPERARVKRIPGTARRLQAHKYFIIEDTCGDGGDDACQDSLTGKHLVIRDPAANHAVSEGPILDGTCAARYVDTIVLSADARTDAEQIWPLGSARAHWMRDVAEIS
jgi:hypothetical protein